MEIIDAMRASLGLLPGQLEDLLLGAAGLVGLAFSLYLLYVNQLKAKQLKYYSRQHR